MIKYIIFALCLGSSVTKADELRVDGLFSGTINYFDSNITPADIQVNIQLVENTEESSENYKVEGGIVVNREGGPYVFTSAGFDFLENKIDLKYFRPSNQKVADFRLIGYFDVKNRISGDVYTKRHGKIGRFSLERQGDYQPISRKSVYSGKWSGWATTLSGLEIPFSISMFDSMLDSKNPENFEFETTPGKVASMSWGGSQFSIPLVSIDYLRSVVLMSSSTSGSEFNIEFKMNEETGEISGFVNSGLQGRSAEFVIPKVR